MTAGGDFLSVIRALIARGDFRVSLHGFRELAADEIELSEILDGVDAAEAIEEYPTFPKGPCVLVLQRTRRNRPLHVLWGIPRGHDAPAVLITAYRPDPTRWSTDFMRRTET